MEAGDDLIGCCHQGRMEQHVGAHEEYRGCKSSFFGRGAQDNLEVGEGRKLMVKELAEPVYRRETQRVTGENVLRLKETELLGCGEWFDVLSDADAIDDFAGEHLCRFF